MNARRFLCLVVVLMIAGSVVPGQVFDPIHLQGMQWRCIGPFRGGRTVGAVGIPSKPNVFFIGVNNGGVWKTTDAGRTWNPIFDDQPTGSIGDVAVSESNPDIIYVGSGEGLPLRPDLSVGDGLYKSTDGGKTWRNMGLRDGQQIGGVVVDPKNPNRVFVAVCGHPFGPNEERGVFRTLDGGETWQKVLYKNENTGAIQVAFDPQDPSTIYADLYEVRHGPWENGQWTGPGSGLYKSTDGGNTWSQLTGGLPGAEQNLGRIGFGISRSNPKTIYATVEAGQQAAGIYRSDDAGSSWKKVSSEARVYGRGSDFAEIKVHPNNPEMVYVANTASYKSSDGGKTWTAFKGAPGGDDYHRIWINPNNPEIMLIASDQGATITVNGGESWSSWYNQPTAQMYHVATDNRFPYWVYSGQQESGSIAVSSRGDYGAITWKDWRTVGAEEYGYTAPDPLNPDITYGGKITRYDWKTGQVQNIAPETVRSGKYRFLRTAPVIFSQVDKKTLYYAGNVLFKTLDGGNSWSVISPDLTREKYDIPASIGTYRKPEMATMQRRGVIYTIGPSFQDLSTIWIGTDDGLIQLTRDGGKSWKNVTPGLLSSWMKVSLIEASHFDNDSAYAAINTLKLDDMRPHILRTHDGGKTWKEIVKGIPEGNPINVVREDPVRKGLLYAGSERAVFVSLDDGENWQSLRLNMPATSIRDLVVKDDDLVVGTHGRSFWILDNVTPLRQLNAELAGSSAHLYKPQLATRVRRSINTDTPIPPEEPMGKNPPDGAMIDYWLKTNASEVTLEILDQKGAVVRKYSSKDQPERINENTQAYPSYWFRAPKVLSAAQGAHRWVWDLRLAPPAGFPRTFGMQAILHDTPSSPLGPVVLPGEYQVRLTVDGKVMSQPLTIRMDPRVKTPAADLARMNSLSFRCYQGISRIRSGQQEIRSLREQLSKLKKQTQDAQLIAAIDAVDAKAGGLEGRTAGLDAFGGSGREPGLAGLATNLLSVMNVSEEADLAPTTQALAAGDDLEKRLAEMLDRLKALREQDVTGLNAKLRQAGLGVIEIK